MANVSSSNGLEKHLKLRFKGFSEPWKTVRIGDVYAERSERGAEDMELLSVTMNDGVKMRSDIEGKDNSSEDKSNYKIVRAGDMVYNSMRMWQGANGISPWDGIVSPAYTVLKPRMPISNGFFAALFKTHRLINEFRKNSQGMTSDTWNLKYPQIETIKTCIPALAEQEKIADFLMALDQRIEKQRTLVEHLKKYKRGALQHIFHKMTDCSTVTVGDVFTKANKRNSDGRVKNVITNSAEYGLIPQRDFFDKDIAVDGNTNNYFIIQKGCFVYNPRKSNTAPYGPFNCYQGEEEGIISPLYTCLVKKLDVDSTYLSWYFKSDSWYRYIYDNGSQGVRHDRVSMTDDLLMGIPIKLPNGERQKEIGAFFDAIEAKLKCETDILNALIKIKNGLYDKMLI